MPSLYAVSIYILRKAVDRTLDSVRRKYDMHANLVYTSVCLSTT